MNSIGNKPDLMHKVVDKPQRADKQADLDSTTVGKRSHIAMSHQSLLPLQPQLSLAALAPQECRVIGATGAAHNTSSHE